jgi:hypothetical protein
MVTGLDVGSKLLQREQAAYSMVPALGPDKNLMMRRLLSCGRKVRAIAKSSGALYRAEEEQAAICHWKRLHDLHKRSQALAEILQSVARIFVVRQDEVPLPDASVLARYHEIAALLMSPGFTGSEPK